ncbi:hypothetical protein I307_01776 [Cryptococcus deuterogattii 99/473]|nr:hypothetical protein I307_01776 [Cryptococcus deuterogattii 99/473]
MTRNAQVARIEFGNFEHSGDSVPFGTLLAYDAPLRTYRSALQAVQLLTCRSGGRQSQSDHRNCVRALRTLHQQRRSSDIWETSVNRSGCCKICNGFAKVAADGPLPLFWIGGLIPIIPPIS